MLVLAMQSDPLAVQKGPNEGVRPVIPTDMVRIVRPDAGRSRLEQDDRRDDRWLPCTASALSRILKNITSKYMVVMIGLFTYKEYR